MPSTTFLIPALFALLLMSLPGLLLSLVAHSREARWLSAARLPDLFGLSFALIAVAGAATFFLNIRFNSITILPLFAALLSAVFVLLWRSAEQKAAAEAAVAAGRAPSWWKSSLVLIIFILIVVFRIYQARMLVLPAWVDSVHHTLLVRIITEHGGLPRTLEPWMPTPLYYHVGFHTNAALFGYFSRLEPAQTVLAFGQFLNAAVSFAMYRLALSIWADNRRAITAMLLTGFVFQMPSYYLTWGRYTLLAGLFLLALAMAAVLDTRQTGVKRPQIISIGILTAGLLVTHYYAALVFALFLVVFALSQFLDHQKYLFSRDFWSLVLAAGWGSVLALPWVLNVLRGVAAYVRVDFVSPAQPLDAVYTSGYMDYLWYLLGPYRSHVLHGLGLVGLLLLGWKRPVRPFTLFALAFGVLSLPWGFQLVPFRPDHGVILAFLPASVFLADLLVTPLDAPFKPRLAFITRLACLAAGAGLLIWGVKEMRSIVNPVTVLADEADLEAMDWIVENTREDDFFLINTAGWQGGAYRGVDGGWWISVLTGRPTLLPPVLYQQSERAFALAVLDRAARMAGQDRCDQALRDLIAETGAEYLYLRSGRGALQPVVLLECDGFDPDYVSGGVYIFSVLP